VYIKKKEIDTKPHAMQMPIFANIPIEHTPTEIMPKLNIPLEAIAKEIMHKV